MSANNELNGLDFHSALKQRVEYVQNPLNRLVSPYSSKIDALLQHKEIRSIVGLLVGAGFGFAARGGITYDTFMNLLQERWGGATGVDTGPTEYGVLLEGLSNICTIASLAYFGGGTVMSNFIHGKKKDLGLADLYGAVSGKSERLGKWHDHIVVLDNQRTLFDPIESQFPQRKRVLLHDGRLLQPGDELEGGQLSSKSRRHLNSLGLEHLSDKTFLERAHLTDSSVFIVNLTQQDQILGLGGQIGPEKKPLPISPEKVFNILTTISNNWPGVRIIGVVPEGYAWEYGEVSRMFSKAEFPNLNIDCITPEAIFAKNIAAKLNKGGAQNNNVPFAFESDDANVSSMVNAALNREHVNLQKPSDAQVVAVYRKNDDMTIVAAKKLKQEYPDKKIVACIERETNIDEAKASADSFIYVPELVAADLPIKRK